MLLALSATFLLLALFSMTALLLVDYRKTLAEAETRNEVIAQLVEAHARRSLEIAKGALLEAAEAVVTDDGLRPSAESAARMRRWINEFPGIRSFWLIDTGGDLIFSTEKYSGDGFNFSDRPYFKAHAAGEELYVGGIIRGRVTGTWLFTLSKRLTDRSGRFRGLLLAAIPTDFFTDLYRKIELGPEDNISIYKTDGAIVVRRLQTWQGAEPPSLANSPLLTEHLPRSPRSSYRAVSPVDGVDRLNSYRLVEGWPLVVLSGLEWQRLLQPWRHRTAVLIPYCLAVLAAIGGLTLWAHRRVRGEELALAKNEVLLNEVHHRVKNNLAIVQSLLIMEMKRCPPELSHGYRDSIARIEAIGLVHHLLYEFQNFEGIEAADYLRRLCDGLQSTAADVRIEVVAEEVSVSLDKAVPMALIANEAITNAIKHAFPAGQPGDIVVKLRRHAEKAELSVQDNGRGLPSGAGEGGTLGMILIRLLARQIDGALSIGSDNGASVTVTFPLAS
ncbi:MAG TPA: hypothetical protein HPQ04_04360 [Rhodospirillaceae bacterium]|nr:hypothetical protein [Rhodospirillaceae bacterium]